jgi:hypothetical protein
MGLRLGNLPSVPTFGLPASFGYTFRSKQNFHVIMRFSEAQEDESMQVKPKLGTIIAGKARVASILFSLVLLKYYDYLLDHKDRDLVVDVLY